MDRRLLVVDRALLAITLVVLVLGVAGGPGWLASSHEAVLATQLERSASAPLFGLLAAIAAHLPFGEPGFRVGLLGAVLGAFVVLGVVRAARALLPRDPVAGLAGAVLLVLAQPFRDAAGFAAPSTLAACGAVWTLVFAIEHRREPTPRRALAAIACAGVVVGAAPWLGAIVALALLGWLARETSRSLLTSGFAGLGGIAVVLWIDALGRLPPLEVDLAALIGTSGRGAAAVVVGAGLLGTAFAVATSLPNAPVLAASLAIAAGHALAFDHDPTVLLALLAVGSAVIPSAVVRVVPRHRHLVAAAAGVPLVVAALLVSHAGDIPAGDGVLGVDDPGAAPARLAADLTDELPPGPGVFVTTRPTTFAALEYARLVAGDRPDLVLVPPIATATADVIVANSLRTGRIAGADTFAFGRLDPRRAVPRGRGFQLLGAEPEELSPIRGPARYASEIGAAAATLLALELARYEGGFGRLDAAAHAAGLASRFRAADLAILATAAPRHPALFGFLPRFDTPVGPWLLEVLGDDLAWVVGLEVPEAAGPPMRKLHGLWRRLLAGGIKQDDPAIVALGPAAVAATQAMLTALAKP